MADHARDADQKPTVTFVPTARAGASPTRRISAGIRSEPRIRPTMPPSRPITSAGQRPPPVCRARRGPGRFAARVRPGEQLERAVEQHRGDRQQQRVARNHAREVAADDRAHDRRWRHPPEQPPVDPPGADVRDRRGRRRDRADPDVRARAGGRRRRQQQHRRAAGCCRARGRRGRRRARPGSTTLRGARSPLGILTSGGKAVRHGRRSAAARDGPAGGRAARGAHAPARAGRLYRPGAPARRPAPRCARRSRPGSCTR